MGFLAQHLPAFTAATLQQLDEDEAARRAQRLGHLADLQRRDHGIQGRRQLGSLAPAHLAALQGVLVGGTGDGQLGEIGAAAQLGVDVARLALGGLDGAAGRPFGQRNQQAGQAQVLGQLQLAQVRGEEILHFLVTDLDTFGHAALAHPTDDHLAAHLFAGALVGQAVAGECGAELVEAQTVALGDAGHGLVELGVADADAGALADLQLDVLDDQAFQHLLGEHMLGRQGRAAPTDGLLHFAQTGIQLALHDDVAVHDGGHAIQRTHLGAGGGGEQQGAQQQRAQTVSELVLHVFGNLECLDRGRTLTCCRSRRRVP